MDGWMDGWMEGGREGWRDGWREGGREGWRDGGRKEGRGRERGREGGRDGEDGEDGGNRDTSSITQYKGQQRGEPPRSSAPVHITNTQGTDLTPAVAQQDVSQGRPLPPDEKHAVVFHWSSQFKLPPKPSRKREAHCTAINRTHTHCKRRRSKQSVERLRCLL